MRVLVACEFSGVVRDAFLAAGHDAISCDIIPTESPGPHNIGDVLEIIDQGWDLMIAHLPCTYLCASGARWWAGCRREQGEALEFVRRLLAAPIPKIALENPIGCISGRIRRPDQIVHPWQFGEEVSKSTCLWLKNLPPLTPTKIVGKGQFVTAGDGKRQAVFFATAHYGGQDRRKVRSRTFRGMAEAMASQWGVT